MHTLKTLIICMIYYGVAKRCNTTKFIDSANNHSTLFPICKKNLLPHRFCTNPTTGLCQNRVVHPSSPYFYVNDQSIVVRNCLRAVECSSECILPDSLAFVFLLLRGFLASINIGN